jgi:hypothetical protein
MAELHGKKRQPQDPGSNNEPGAPSATLYFPEKYRSDILSTILMPANIHFPTPGHPPARAAIGQAALDKAQASATPGAFKSYLVKHKKGLGELAFDAMLASTPAPEARWAFKAKKLVEKVLFAHTVHDLLP